MNISICEDISSWDSFFFSQNSAEFLQSWDWGEFQKSIGHNPIRIQITEGNTIIAQFQLFEHSLPFGKSFLYGPRIIVPDNGKIDFSHIFDWIKKEYPKAIFLRVESSHKNGNISLYYKQVHTRQPEYTFVTDLTKSEDDILSLMHAKTRYNIRLAAKKGVQIKKENNINWFWKLNQETTTRDGFKSHGKEYYENMLSLPIVHQFTAFYDNEPIASNLYIGWGGRFTYLHGTSSNQHRNLMAPYLLQWHAMQFGQKTKNNDFDFWGIAPTVEEDVSSAKTCFHGLCWQADHKWTGITRFKVGFGGRTEQAGKAYEIPLKKFMYKIFCLLKKFV